MPFYYLTANKTRNVFHNSGPLSLLRLKNSWRGALISVDLLKITLLHILFVYFYNRLIFRGAYIRNYFCVSGFIYGKSYIREGGERWKGRGGGGERWKGRGGGGEEVLIYRVLWYSVFSFASTIYTEMNKIFNSIMVVKVWVLGTALVKQHLKRLSSFELFYVQLIFQFKNLSRYHYRYYL